MSCRIWTMRRFPRKGRSKGPLLRRSRIPATAFIFALYLFPELEDWLPLLRRLGLSAGDGAYLAALASRNGTDFQTELLASGLVGEEEFCRALAEELGVGQSRPDRPGAADRLRRACRLLPAPFRLAHPGQACRERRRDELSDRARTAFPRASQPADRGSSPDTTPPASRRAGRHARGAPLPCPAIAREAGDQRPFRPPSGSVGAHRRQCVAGLDRRGTACGVSRCFVGRAGRRLAGAALGLLSFLSRLRRPAFCGTRCPSGRGSRPNCLPCRLPTCRYIRCWSRSIVKPRWCRNSSRRCNRSIGRRASSRSSSSARRTTTLRSVRYARFRCRETWRWSKCRSSARAPSRRRSPMRCR